MQLTFWAGRYPWSDTTPLLEQIVREGKEGRKVSYHFCGKPIR